MSGAFEDLAAAVLETVARQTRNTAPRVERYRVVGRNPLRLEGIDSEISIAEGEDDVEVYGSTSGLVVGTVLPVTRTEDAYIIQAPGAGSGGGGTGGTGDKNYVHTQGTGATTWDVAHDLGKFPAVSIVDFAGTELLPDIVHLDTNNVRLTFGLPVSGKAYIN